MSEERLQEIKDSIEFQVLYTEKHNFDKTLLQEEVDLYNEVIKLNTIINGINSYCFKRMAELDDIREKDKKLEDFCDNKINAFLEVREKIKELERSDKE